MKSLVSYIFESVELDKLLNVFKSYHDQLKSNNDLQKEIGTDIRSIFINDRPFLFNQINGNKTLLELINDENIGLEFISQFVKTPDNFIDNANKYQLNCYLYGYKRQNKDTNKEELYFIGMIITNPQYAQIENYVNVVIADTIKTSQNKEDDLFEMHKQLSDLIYSKNKQFLGFSFSSKNNNLKKQFIDAKYKKSDVSDDVFIMKKY